jgi:hypothetical protein
MSYHKNIFQKYGGSMRKGEIKRSGFPEKAEP